ncbi:hypothetical protein [Brevibacillus laterosporus]|uniref:hypothetical protein n=1 Tax=Brevibacillus laterosporus TaxID=1465 RepID=UPI0026531681|nr:hypothetical protein [Brevibacillus laterosporus]MDN9011615.1 hypothetical protein [Brevibacillus laterosporus]MDO0942562.1 hypothetical protein [Brevibacillus laterosporus]
MNEIIRALCHDSADSGFLNCLHVRYKADMFSQYCLFILKNHGEACIVLNRKETTTGSSDLGLNNIFEQEDPDDDQQREKHRRTACRDLAVSRHLIRM